MAVIQNDHTHICIEFRPMATLAAESCATNKYCSIFVKRNHFLKEPPTDYSFIFIS